MNEISDKQFDCWLIDEYSMLRRIRETAVRENSPETVKAIDEEINIIKLKLRPLKLPEL